MYQETTILAMPVWADGLAPTRPRKIDNTRERDYNKDKGNTAGRRLTLGISQQKMTVILGRGGHFLLH